MTDNDQTKPFASWLCEQGGGKTEAELTEGLRDVVQRVIDTGKKGAIILTVNVGLMKENTDIVVVTDEIKLKLPEHDRKPGLYWTDDDGNLLRNDPNQRSIFDEITGQKVNADTGEVQE